MADKTWIQLLWFWFSDSVLLFQVQGDSGTSRSRLQWRSCCSHRQCVPPAGVWGAVVLSSKMLVWQSLPTSSGSPPLEAQPAALCTICQVPWWGMAWCKHTAGAFYAQSSHSLVLCRCWPGLQVRKWPKNQRDLCPAQRPPLLAGRRWMKVAVRAGVPAPCPPNNWSSLQLTSRSCRTRFANLTFPLKLFWKFPILMLCWFPCRSQSCWRWWSSG